MHEDLAKFRGITEWRKHSAEGAQKRLQVELAFKAIVEPQEHSITVERRDGYDGSEPVTHSALSTAAPRTRRRGARREAPSNDSHGVDFDYRALVGVVHVEVGRRMVVMVHLDADSSEAADLIDTVRLL